VVSHAFAYGLLVATMSTCALRITIVHDKTMIERAGDFTNNMKGRSKQLQSYLRALGSLTRAIFTISGGRKRPSAYHINKSTFDAN